jgi:hypothetical protein
LPQIALFSFPGIAACWKEQKPAPSNVSGVGDLEDTGFVLFAGMVRTTPRECDIGQCTTMSDF